VKFKDMDRPQQLQWGADEDRRRALEIGAIKTQDDLERVQASIKKRRLVVGLNAGQTVVAMSDSRRAKIQARPDTELYE
jgi:hypothetical protein